MSSDLALRPGRPFAAGRTPTADPPVATTEAVRRGGSLTVALARRRHGGQFSRSAILWAVLVYAFAQVVIGVAISRWHPRIAERLPDEVWHKKRKRFFQMARAEPDRPVVVMFGSSARKGPFRQAGSIGLPGASGKPILAYNFGVPASGPMRRIAISGRRCSMPVSAPGCCWSSFCRRSEQATARPDLRGGLGFYPPS